MPHRALLLALSALAILSPALDAQRTSEFRARLSTVPIDLTMLDTVAGRGSVTARLAGDTLTIDGTFADLKSPATLAKIHAAPKGLRGPAVFDLTVTPATSGTITGRLTLTAAQLEDLRDSRLYVQLHSAKAPDGNLWGWLLPEEKKR